MVSPSKVRGASPADNTLLSPLFPKGAVASQYFLNDFISWMFLSWATQYPFAIFVLLLCWPRIPNRFLSLRAEESMPVWWLSAVILAYVIDHCNLKINTPQLLLCITEALLSVVRCGYFFACNYLRPAVCSCEICTLTRRERPLPLLSPDRDCRHQR